MTRVALVTGAAGGLPRGAAIALAAAGYRVAVGYRPGGTPPGETLATIADGGGMAVAVQADFMQPGAASAAVAAAEAVLGPIDVLVHGVGPMHVRRFADCTRADYDEMLEGNLGSAVELAFAVLPGMRRRRFGRLIFFGMNGSHVTQPSVSLSLYGAAKAGLCAFARTLALEEAASGITVNVVEPGDIRSKALDREGSRRIAANNPTGHSGSWEDIAYAVRFLVADEAGFVNGATLGVSGGLVGAHE